MWAATSCEACIISTAPIAKLGATKQLASPPEPSTASRSASRSKPVVPTTAWTPASRQAAALTGAVSGVREVDDHLGAGEHIANAASQGGIGATGELHVLGAGDGFADRLAHPPRSAGDGYAHRLTGWSAHAATRLSLTLGAASRKSFSSRPTAAAESRSPA